MTVAAAAEPDVDARIVHVAPGSFEVIDAPGAAVSTLLGSCVSACIRDVRLGVGGLNHFLLPGDDEAGALRSARYGMHAMEALINAILRRGGARRALEAKIFGGANVIETSSAITVGDRNVRFVEDYLKAEGIPVAASDLGGARARRVWFYPSTGRVTVRRLPETATRETRARETRFRREVASAPQAGKVELF